MSSDPVSAFSRGVLTSMVPLLLVAGVVLMVLGEFAASFLALGCALFGGLSWAFTRWMTNKKK